MKRTFPQPLLILGVMTLALALFQRGGALLPALTGALLFGALALLRPDLGLLFVVLVAPLYLMPAVLPSLRADSPNAIRLPTYEIALLLVFGATMARWLWRRISAVHQFRAAYSGLIQYAPQLLFLLAGALGVVLAAEQSRALREFRWLIVEPLLFYALLKSQVVDPPTTNREPTHSQCSKLNSSFSIPIVTAFVLGGALVGLIGLLQFAGPDLAGLLGTKQCFAASGAPCDNVVATGGVRRVTSVYGHPNNLGLYLGRVWPLAAALAFATYREQPATNNKQRARLLFFVCCSVFCLGGIAVSFSRGAWLGSIAALAVLGLGVALIRAKDKRHTATGKHVRLALYAAPVLALAVVAGLALSLRGDVTGGSTPTRLLLWREAIGYIRQHPLGIGLDQFGYYHDPSFAGSLIDPALVGTSEQYAAHPHNLLLDIWLRLGPLGLVAFGWLLARFFRRGLRAMRAGADPVLLGALAAMIAALAHGLVDNFYFVPDLALAFWLLLAITE
jgi:putative inorganic carbon (hco3(-)) transporter